MPGLLPEAGVGEEPADGDRVAGGERRLRGARSLGEQEAGVGAMGPEVSRDQNWEAVRAGLGQQDLTKAENITNCI